MDEPKQQKRKCQAVADSARLIITCSIIGRVRREGESEDPLDASPARRLRLSAHQTCDSVIKCH